MSRPTPKAAAVAPSSFGPPTNVLFFAGAATRKRQLELAEQQAAGQHNGGFPQQWTPKQTSLPGNYAESSAAPAKWQKHSHDCRPAPKASGKGAKPTALRPKQPSQPPPHITSFAVPFVSWIQVGSTAQMVLEGYPAMAPAVLHSVEIQPLMSAANNLLYELAGDAASAIVLNDDTDWTANPEVGQALKSSGYEEVSMCIAICPTLGTWAVGLASQKKSENRPPGLRFA